MLCFALIHSPLVGPLTWKLVANHLERKGFQVVLPSLADSENVPKPLWEQHAESAAKAINGSKASDACILVGHSGAGPILPAIGERLNSEPRAYIFVDAGLPHSRASRLDLMKIESPEWASEFEKYLIAGGCFPNWSEADLANIILDRDLRQQMLRELRPRALSFFSEVITIAENWSATLCGYIQLSKAYDVPAAQAAKFGWPAIKFESDHFHMLVDPTTVTNAIIQVAGQALESPK